jgi:hypothetical protein
MQAFLTSSFFNLVELVKAYPLWKGFLSLEDPGELLGLRLVWFQIPIEPRAFKQFLKYFLQYHHLRFQIVPSSFRSFLVASLLSL